jgi:hypothetical protein
MFRVRHWCRQPASVRRPIVERVALPILEPVVVLAPILAKRFNAAFASKKVDPGSSEHPPDDVDSIKDVRLRDNCWADFGDPATAGPAPEETREKITRPACTLRSYAFVRGHDARPRCPLALLHQIPQLVINYLEVRDALDDPFSFRV